MYIIGAGGFGKEVKSMLPYINSEFTAFIDDNITIPQVHCPISSIDSLPADAKFILAIGNSTIRKKIVERIKSTLQFPVIIHPSALIQDQSSVQINKGSIITAGSILTCDISIGKYCVVNLNCTIGHGVKISDYCSLMPSVNLGGDVVLKEGVYLGTGVNVLPGIEIGANSIIAAGAVVTKNVPANSKWAGVPAHPMI